MKKLLAIILTVVMLFGVVAISTSADTAAPKVTIVTNEGSAVAKGVPTYFTVKFENFSEIKGIDVTITADQNIELGEVTTTGFPKAEADVNFTEENEGAEHTIRFVDLTAGEDGKITFKAWVPTDAATTGDPSITVAGKYAKDGKTLFEVEAPAAGTFELVKEIEVSEPVQTETTIKAPANKFIPVGGVYTGTGNNVEYVEKNEDGSFTAPAGAVYQSFDVPTNGITTFGASDDPQDNTRLRFGSYSNLNNNAKEHGTLVFEGEWLVLKNYYIQKGYTVQQFVKALYNDVTAKLAANPDADFVYYKVNGETINVYRFKQQNYMWKGGEVLEYAIRLNGVKTDKTYTGVAYSISSNDVVTLSEDVKSVTK